ncbi:MAG: GNAT family protein [Candidatus Gracilibacteria bacterium]|nr:GNAT family protein [Candidatus Gracilibacteria bacterium]
MELILRELQLDDLNDYLKYTHPSREYRKYNGPYFKQETEEELGELIERYREKLNQGEHNVLRNKKLIVNKATDEIIGEVNWYWKSEETLWMELGIVIFNEKYWGQGIGYIALKMWISEKFKEDPRLVRLGLTTWSGNIGMMKLSEKLGFKKEAVYRKARIVNGEYFDSVSYGILREEWEQI